MSEAHPTPERDADAAFMRDLADYPFNEEFKGRLLDIAARLTSQAREIERLKTIIATADGKSADSFDWSVLGTIDELEQMVNEAESRANERGQQITQLRTVAKQLAEACESAKGIFDLTDTLHAAAQIRAFDAMELTKGKIDEIDDAINAALAAYSQLTKESE